MIRAIDQLAVCSRRPFLQAGAAAALGLFWNDWLKAESTQPAKGHAKSVILIFNSGAPSHIDLWDPKPNAGETVRGPFKPIQTNVTGVQVSQLLPRLSKLANRCRAALRDHAVSALRQHGLHHAGAIWRLLGGEVRSLRAQCRSECRQFSGQLRRQGHARFDPASRAARSAGPTGFLARVRCE